MVPAVGPGVAVDIDDREFRSRHRMLIGDERRGRPVIDDRGRRELRRLACADANERRARWAFASCRGDAAPAAALLRHDGRGEQPGGQ